MLPRSPWEGARLTGSSCEDPLLSRLLVLLLLLDLALDLPLEVDNFRFSL